MAVPADPAHADLARVDHHDCIRCAHHVEAAVREWLRTDVLGVPVQTQHGWTAQPYRGVQRVARRPEQVSPRVHRPANRQVPTVRANRLFVQIRQPAVVVVADLGEAAVGPCVGTHELEHPLQPLAHRGRHWYAVALAQQHTRVPQLGYQPLIADALLEIDAVGVDLPLHLAPDDLSPLLAPRAGFCEVGQQHAEEQEPDAVRQIVVAVDVGVLQVGEDVPAVLEHGLQDAAFHAVRELGSVGEERRCPQPVHRAHGHLHGSAPVDAVRPRVVVEPGLELVDEFLRICRVGIKRVGAPERHPVVTPTQLPGHLDVAGFAQAQVVLVFGEHVGRPGKAGLEVAVPVDTRAEVSRTRAEQVDHVVHRLLGRGSGAPGVLGVGLCQGSGASASLGRIDKEALHKAVKGLLG